MKSKLDDAWCEKLQNHNDSKRTHHNLQLMSTPPQTENSLVTLDVNRPPVEDHYGYIALEIRRVCATCR